MYVGLVALVGNGWIPPMLSEDRRLWRQHKEAEQGLAEALLAEGGPRDAASLPDGRVALGGSDLVGGGGGGGSLPAVGVVDPDGKAPRMLTPAEAQAARLRRSGGGLSEAEGQKLLGEVLSGRCVPSPLMCSPSRLLPSPIPA